MIDSTGTPADLNLVKEKIWRGRSSADSGAE